VTIYEQCGATLLHRPTPPPRTVTPGLMQQLFPAIQRSHEGLIDRPIVGGVHPRRPKTREPCALSLHAIPGRERFRIAPPFPVGIPSAVSPKSEARPPAGGRQAPAELLQPHLRILGRTGRHTLFAGSRVQLGVRSPDAVRWGPFQVVARTAWPARCACEVACPFTGAPRGGLDRRPPAAGGREDNITSATSSRSHVPLVDDVRRGDCGRWARTRAIYHTCRLDNRRPQVQMLLGRQLESRKQAASVRHQHGNQSDPWARTGGGRDSLE
jgi:hypothetical protein